MYGTFSVGRDGKPLIERVVGDFGRVYPDYKVIAPDGQEISATPTVSSHGMSQRYVPTQDDIQQIIAKNWHRIDDPKYRIALRKIFAKAAKDHSD
ncbi:hypothetical protein KA107_00070 [Candidatus Pacearchaeota archaeon]|nr:hypothetical protein [Candidatus Pacearchaeota archaeon]